MTLQQIKQEYERIKTSVEKQLVQLDEARERIEKLEKMESKPTPEERFMQLVDGLEILPKKEKWPDSLFFAKNGEIWFEWDQKNNYLWCRYDTVWRVFETEFGLNYDEIQSIIKEQVEQAYGLKGVTPHLHGQEIWFQEEQAYGLKRGGTGLRIKRSYTLLSMLLVTIQVEQAYGLTKNQ
jgi:hypothetical protein